MQFAVQGAVLDDQRQARGQVRLHRGERGAQRQRREPLAQAQALAAGDEQAGGDLLGQVQHPQRIARGDGAHADLVLVVALGGAAEDRGRHGLLERLRGPGGHADLQRLQAVIDRRALAAGAGQVGRQAVVVARVHQQRQLAVQQVGQVGDGRLQRIHRHRDMAAVEMAAMQHALANRIDQRVVVGAVELVLDQLPQPGQRVFHDADDVRRAAQRVAILQPLLVARGAVARQVAAQALRHALLAGMRLGGEERLVEVVRVARAGDHVHRGDAGGQVGQVLGALEGQAGQSGHDGRAVHDRQAFLGAQPQRRRAHGPQRVGGRQGLAVDADLALAAQHGGQVGQRGQVAAGADRAFARDQRQDVVAQQALDLAQQVQAHARQALAQRGQARAQHGARLGRRQQRAGADAVVGVEVMRQFRHQRRGHGHGAGIAVAGGDAVDHAVLGQQPGDEVGAGLDARLEGAIAAQFGRGLAPRQGADVLDAQAAAVKQDGRHGGRAGRGPRRHRS